MYYVRLYFQYIISGSDDFNLYMWKIPDENFEGLSCVLVTVLCLRVSRKLTSVDIETRKYAATLSLHPRNCLQHNGWVRPIWCSKVTGQS